MNNTKITKLHKCNICNTNYLSPIVLHRHNKEKHMDIDINNHYIDLVPYGKENIEELMSPLDKLNLLNAKESSLKFYVDFLYFNENYPQFQNIAITNLKSNIAYKLDIITYLEDDDDKIPDKFIAVMKVDLISEIIDKGLHIISICYEELINDLDEETKNDIKIFIDKMNNKSYYNKRMKELKELIYTKSKIPDNFNVIIV